MARFASEFTCLYTARRDLDMSRNLKIAIVEDHDDLRESFVEHLQSEGFSASGFCCGEELDEYLTHHQPAILILDIGLPGENGFDIAKRLRTPHPNMYIILLTVLASESDKILGYQCGADIYLSKPVSAPELSAAIQSAGRRLLLTEAPANKLQLHLGASTLKGPKTSTQLNHQEKLLLKSLAEAKDFKLPTWRLLEVVSEATGVEAEKAYLELQIFRLRKKLLDAGATTPAIKARWKEGYQLLQQVEIKQ